MKIDGIGDNDDDNDNLSLLLHLSMFCIWENKTIVNI